MPDWAYVIITVMALYAGTTFQLHRLQKQIEAGFSLVHEELARAAGNNERAEEIREEWRQGSRQREMGAPGFFDHSGRGRSFGAG